MKWSLGWIVGGALAANGLFWASMLPLAQLADPTGIAMGAALIAGLLTGALIAKHAAVRPWREPLIAALLGLVIVAARPSVGWMAFAGWTWGAMIATAGIGSIVGAMLVRQFARMERSTLSTVAASMAIHWGVGILAFWVPGDPDGGSILVFLAGTVVAGFLTQLVIRRASSAICACGPFVYVLLMFLPGNHLRELPVVLVGCMMMFLLAWLGSGLARRLVVGAPPAAELPTARLR